jgi:hypothetical protein
LPTGCEQAEQQCRGGQHEENEEKGEPAGGGCSSLLLLLALPGHSSCCWHFRGRILKEMGANDMWDVEMALLMSWNDERQNWLDKF